jgi:hypothetical protein
MTGTVHARVQGSGSAVVEKDMRVHVRGYLRALQRLENAERAVPRRPDDIYIALSETAHWLVILERKLPRDRDFKGVKFARNRADHQWASVTYFDRRQARSVWRAATQLPSSPRHPDAGLERCYQDRLEAKPILDVFRRLKARVKAL